ncbi:MAG: hypothetical protein KIS78_06270 [Labilithrix sp.]|nr:hypothetical protein [Labilithrix sp.]
MRSFRVILALVLAGVAGCSLLVDLEPFHGGSTPADAAPDSAAIDFGSGKDGELTVSTEAVVNDYAAIVETAIAGARRLVVGDGAQFVAGDAVLVWQTVGRDTSPVGDPRPIAPTEGAGRYALARVTATESNAMTLDRALDFDVLGGLAQVVRVREYSALTVQSGGAIRALPWDGSVGGVVAIFVAGSLVVDGTIAASGAGSRGGRAALTLAHLLGCEKLEGTSGDGYAPRGEGIVAGYDGVGDPASAPGGRGNEANGGGGGNCHNAGGGGGGGSGGAGGVGGDSWEGDMSRPVGGAGGVALAAPLGGRFFLGGGGGAGHADGPADDQVASSGAAGGGVVFVRAASVVGNGAIVADGEDALAAVDQGGGGGGGGGSILVESGEPVRVAVSARGGRGADTTAAIGPGGGGGGGRIRLAPPSAGARNDVGGGASGTTPNLPRGAAPGAPGVIE